MANLIDKSALVAEIEKLIEKAKAERVLYPKTILSAKNYLLIEDYNKLLSFINSLEVKEVDLEKEIELVKGDYEQVDVAWNNDFDFIARHFFELGMAVSNKAQKGE